MKKRLASALMALLLLCSLAPAASAAAFVDVPENH